MKRLIFASVLAVSTLWLATPAKAAVPPLPAPVASFNAGSLHIDVYGAQNKPAMIFIPGLTCGPWEWAGEIRHFSSDYSVYALTLPGFDGQPAVTGDLFGKVSSDFWNLLSSHRIAKPIVIGHSLGGTLGFMLAQQHSDRLGALIAVDGMPIFPGMQLVDATQRSAMAQRMASMMGAMKTPAQFEAAERTYSLPFMVSSPADVDAIAPLTARSDADATARWMQQDLTLDLRPNLSAIAIPVLELVPFDPKLDPNGPAKLASAAQKQAYYGSLLKGDPTAKVQVIEPSRHFIMYDQPDALHAAIVSFIENREP
jgi:pimeloyl-ACP methyl ester carboxylesterase